MKNRRLDQRENDFPEKLSNPARRALAGAGIERLEQLTTFTEDQIKKLHGIGPNAIAQLMSALGTRGLSFAKGKKEGLITQMKIHLVDGTYELFRNHFGAPPKKAPDGRQVGATLGLLRSLLMLLTSPGVTHVACAFDHVIESFRNDLFPGYKTGAGVDPDLLAQFSLAEKAVSALGVVVWPMVEFEADDALATATARFKNNKSVEQIVICSPDKDLAQLVFQDRIVCWDRRREIVIDEDGVVEKYGVHPQSIPDWLALVGDAADGYPGIPGWGAKSASIVLARFQHIELIPDDPLKWKLIPGRAACLAESLTQHRAEALLYRRLAILRKDVPITEKLGDLKWQGALEKLKGICHDLGDEQIPRRISRWRKD